MGLVGDDSIAEILTTKMKDKKMELKRIVSIHGNSGSTTIKLDENGERTIERNQSVTSELPNQIGIYFRDNILRESIIHIKVNIDTFIQITKYAKNIFSIDISELTQSKNKRLITDLLMNEKGQIRIKIIFGNTDEFNDLMQIFEIQDIFNSEMTINNHISTLKDIKYRFNADYLFIKRGKHGASLYYDEKCFNIEAKNIKVIDTTGAGDAFNAGAIYGILTFTNNPELILKMAVELGSLNCLSYGGQEFGGFEEFKKKYILNV